jgi:hydrogenase maturation protease
VNELDWRLLEDRAPLDSVEVRGSQLRRGDRVRLRPKAGGDILDLAMTGRTAIIHSIEQDYEGEAHLSVLLDDDPGRDFGSTLHPGHRFFFRADEVEPVAPSEHCRRILVAGIGNIFMGDDGLGVEVAQRFAAREAPKGVRVTDFGIRGYDLAYALTSGYDVAILVDATSQGGAPGTLYLIEPELDEAEGQGRAPSPPVADAHALDPLSIMRMAKAFGDLPGRILLLGCEPESLGGDEGRIGLSEAVSAAVDQAVARLDSLLKEPL